MRRRLLLRSMTVCGVIGLSQFINHPIVNSTQPVTAQTNSDWDRESNIFPNDITDGDQFGRSVAIPRDGTTAIVGAPFSNGNDNGTGSAYVFNRDDGSWVQETKLTANDGQTDDQFGLSVALSTGGEKAVIGAPSAVNEGAAYVYNQLSDSWSQEAKITVDNSDNLGSSVAISNNGKTIVANNLSDTGSSAYIFYRRSDSWTEKTKIVAEDDLGDFFAEAIALSGDGRTALFGSTDDAGFNFGGSAYVFSETSDSWEQDAKITVTNGETEEFGNSVSLSNDGKTAVIGAPRDGRSGAAYVFNNINGSWERVARLASDIPDDTDIFGDSVALSGDGKTALIGTVAEIQPRRVDKGSAYVFDASGGSWRQTTKLTANENKTEINFGDTVALSRDGLTALIGASDDSEAGQEAGSAFIFNRRVQIVNPSIQPPEVSESSEPHNLSFDARNVSADGTNEEFADQFEVTFPEEIILEGYSNVDIDVQSSTVEKVDNTLNFSVTPSGGGTTQVSVSMDVTLSPANNQ